MVKIIKGDLEIFGVLRPDKEPVAGAAVFGILYRRNLLSVGVQHDVLSLDLDAHPVDRILSRMNFVRGSKFKQRIEFLAIP